MRQKIKRIIRGIMLKLGKRSLFNSSQTTHSPFFITGSGRCGTTLLRKILMNHREVCIPPESYFSIPNSVDIFCFLNYIHWNILLKTILGIFHFDLHFHFWNLDLSKVFRKLKDEPKSNQTLVTIIESIYEFYIKKHKPTATMWGDKTPILIYGLAQIRELYPNAKYIEIIRDGRDVVASFVDNNLLSLEQACLRWLDAIRLMEEFKNTGANVLSIKYEEFVENPEETIQKICCFLSIPYSSQLLSPSPSEITGDLKLPHHEKLKSPINTQSISQWQNKLSEEKQKIIYSFLSGSLIKLGYI